MQSNSEYSWIIPIQDENDPRFGIQIRHIKSGNDGDICNSVVTYKLLKNKINPYVIDIGVDEGWWSFFCTEINSSVTIDAFEPNPNSFRELIQYLDSTPQIRLHNYAISNKSGFLPFTLESGMSNSRCTNGTVSVPCTTLDRYIKNAKIDLIKIDTEGHDLCILETLHPYIKSINAILFECTVYWYGSTKEECIEKTSKELIYLKQQYMYMHSLSRRGIPPSLTSLANDQEIINFVKWSYENKYQTDILVCNESLY